MSFFVCLSLFYLHNVIMSPSCVGYQANLGQMKRITTNVPRNKNLKPNWKGDLLNFKGGKNQKDKDTHEQ